MACRWGVCATLPTSQLSPRAHVFHDCILLVGLALWAQPFRGLGVEGYLDVQPNVNVKKIFASPDTEAAGWQLAPSTCSIWTRKQLV